MIKSKDGDFFVFDWLRKRNIEGNSKNDKDRYLVCIR